MSVVAAQAGGQEFRATMTGRVSDAQGAVVPGVTIAVTNVDTNVSLATVTNETGVYTVTTLQPGTYRIAASLPGFKTFVREAIVLRTAETGTVNIQLQLGDVEERVTVVGGLSAVESNQSTLAQTMEHDAQVGRETRSAAPPSTSTAATRSTPTAHRTIATGSRNRVIASSMAAAC
jgi:hypothetical protein